GLVDIAGDVKGASRVQGCPPSLWPTGGRQEAVRVPVSDPARHAESAYPSEVIMSRPLTALDWVCENVPSMAVQSIFEGREMRLQEGNHEIRCHNGRCSDAFRVSCAWPGTARARPEIARSRTRHEPPGLRSRTSRRPNPAGLRR